MIQKKLTPTTRQRKYALLSVFDKKGIVELAQAIHEAGFIILSSGGTAKLLVQHSIPVVAVETITGNPECFDGRMKTISFQIEGGILFDRKNATHLKEARKYNVLPIDIVVCNLYPFEETIKKPHSTLQDAIHNIDVGGPTMIRSAAKNFQNVLVITDPSDYKLIAKSIKQNNISDILRLELSQKAFRTLSDYDNSIANYLNEKIS